MDKNQQTKEKTCSFYASDYHFEMMSLPYISKSLDEKKEVLIFTENDLEKTVKTLLTKINLDNNRKKEIININWNNNNDMKIKKIRRDIEGKNDIIIFIKGNEKYIEDTNKNINYIANKKDNIKIIDCYNMDEIGDKINSIVSRYQMILSTTGERKIEKI